MLLLYKIVTPQTLPKDKYGITPAYGTKSYFRILSKIGFFVKSTVESILLFVTHIQYFRNVVYLTTESNLNFIKLISPMLHSRL